MCVFSSQCHVCYSHHSYVFPRLLLSHHFWTDQQRHTFWQHDLRHRLEHLQPVLDHMYLTSRLIDDYNMAIKILQIVRKVKTKIQIEIKK